VRLLYDLILDEKSAPGDYFFEATLIEDQVGPVARVSKKLDPCLLNGDPSSESPTLGAAPQSTPKLNPDGTITQHSYEWFVGGAKQRFINYLKNQPCGHVDALNEKIAITEAQKDGIRMDTAIADLLDLVWIRHNKNLAKNNTLYCLDTDEQGTVRVAPNPHNADMDNALDLVFGCGRASVLNHTLPNDIPEGPDKLSWCLK